MNQPESKKNKFKFSLSELALFFLCAVLVALLLTPSLVARYKVNAELDGNVRVAKFSGASVTMTPTGSGTWNVKVLDDSPFDGNLQVRYDGSGNEVSTYVIVAFDGHKDWKVKSVEHTGENDTVTARDYYLYVKSLDSTHESVIEWKLASGWEYGGHYTYTETTEEGTSVERIVHAFFYPVKYGETMDTTLFAVGDSETKKSIRSNIDLNQLKEVGAVPVAFDAYVMQKEGDAAFAFEAFKRHMRHYTTP